MVSSLASKEGAAAAAADGEVSKNVDEVQGSTAARAEKLRFMHKDVAELLLAGTAGHRRRRRTREQAPAAAEGRERVRYECAFEDCDEGTAEGGGFAPHRLVWAKVKTHPWWPAQVLDPADASELALRQRRRRGATLVGFFGDRTFVWADAADIRPFRDGFPHLAGIGGQIQCTSMPAFASSLGAALGEVARRVNAGLSCSCVAGANRKRQVFANAGVRKGAPGAAFTRDAFRGEAFVEYISALAAVPVAGIDRLDLTIAMSQLRAFTRWRGRAPRPGPDLTSSDTDDMSSNGASEGAAPACRATATATAKRRRSPGDDNDDDDECQGAAEQERMI